MNPSSSRVVFVGLFVAIAMTIFGGAILAVGSLQDAFSPKVTVHAVFAEVGGLETGDNVWSSGMRVGVVDTLAFIEASKVKATLEINTAMAPYIPADSVAKIGSDGLIGNPIVVLSGGTPGGPAIAEGDELAVDVAVSTSDLIATLQVNNENLVEITDDIKAITAQIRAGEGTLGKLLTTDELYGQVQGALSDIEVASTNAKRLTSSLATFSADLNREGQLPHDLVTDTDLLPSVKTAVDDLQAAVARASEMVDNLATDLDDQQTPVGTLLGDREAGGDLKATLANLQQATILLNEDLVAIRSNFLFRPYFKKQERKARKEAKAKEREEKNAR